MFAIDTTTLGLVTLALDAGALRHAAIAQNIANAGTPGYRPQRVSFEEQLGLARQTLAAGGRVNAASYAGVRPTLEPAAESAVALDVEMVRLAQNTLQYQALLRALARRGTIMATAINEGR